MPQPFFISADDLHTRLSDKKPISHYFAYIYVIYVSSRCQSRAKRFFLPVKVLSRFFRRVFLGALTQSVARGEVRLVGQCQALNEPREWRRWMAKLRKMEWVVYAKEPIEYPS
ncbi:hypothetical protein C2W62_03020 [Candidatus Entotheonella serta]|nr:hypothetical protein C2W62_03020 [Candidatus Entotheonella serta]